MFPVMLAALPGTWRKEKVGSTSKIVMKKARPIGKTEIGNVGKNSKVGSSFPTGGRLLSTSAGKTYASPSFKTGKTHKSSTSFGVIWIPRRKINKYYKDTVYNSHRNDRSHDRAPSMYNFMSGDSSNHTLVKKDDESNLLVPEHSGHSSLAAASTGVAVVASELPSDIGGVNPEEKQALITEDKEEKKEASGDTDQHKKKDEYLNSEKVTDKENKSQTETEAEKDKTPKSEKDNVGDNVDSVFLRSAPQQRAYSHETAPEEEDCGMKCLYYTMQCCDCVLM